MALVTTTAPTGQGWIPIALAIDIAPRTAAPALVAGMEVAVWRGESGAVHAWRDRCPHRGMRLSFGFVRGEEISCLYHGWRYGSDGGCRYIPAHPDLEPPKTISADVFACAERGGLVWMRADGEIGEPPDMRDGVVPVRSIGIDAGADIVADRLVSAGSTRTEPHIFSIMAGDKTMICAVQPTGDRRSMLHILLMAPEAVSDTPALQMQASRWGERFRRDCEAAAGARLAPGSEEP
jgi:nitrite reductase/ring-hydroxylating ferredoxin subunit